jgi:hypothetical protein
MDIYSQRVDGQDQRQPEFGEAELATYCLHAITAASELPSQAAVRRLVQVTLTGLRPASRPGQ